MPLYLTFDLMTHKGDYFMPRRPFTDEQTVEHINKQTENVTSPPACTSCLKEAMHDHNCAAVHDSLCIQIYANKCIHLFREHVKTWQPGASWFV